MQPRIRIKSHLPIGKYVLQSWLIDTVYHLLVKNKYGRGGGLINFLPLEREGAYLRGGGLNRGFTVIRVDDSITIIVFTAHVARICANLWEQKKAFT